MDPINSAGIQEACCGDEGHDVTSFVSVCPGGLWTVQQTLMRRTIQNQPTLSVVGDAASWPSDDWPKMGSLCKVRACLKADLEGLSSESDPTIAEPTQEDCISYPRSSSSALQVPLGDWTTLRLGEGQCDVIEACVERMRAREKCEILLSPVENVPGASANQPPTEDPEISVSVELHSFTPGKESWEMSTSEKLEWVWLHKERGGARFRSGVDLWGAADSYSRALKLLITLYALGTKKEDCDCPLDPPDDDSSLSMSASEYKTLKAELHSNLSLCQLKLSQPEKARANAAKATQLEPSGPKAWYRLGQACQQVNELGEARKAFRRLLELQPESPVALRALKDLASKEKETNTQLAQRLSKMFS
ncbi:hypothetical protein NHX12_012631 [Muraenolepis orangiensis]|uniref:FK506-binding protein-like n=1 Tax=Muraenolepis orangiensis TaxID=630683 RepID=A0A9Q0DEI7_9TELE|nr:hypothetical protein NHX12_012631 [Muraenolepis orangiensis]